MICVHCNKEIEFNYLHNEELKARQECFHCNHFMGLLRRPDRSDCLVVHRYDVRDQPIGHYMHGAGGGPHAGFGGDKWTFKLIPSGEILITTNLWHQGTIPDHLLKYFPINAVLVKEFK